MHVWIHKYVRTPHAFLLETYIILELGISAVIDLQIFHISILLKIQKIWIFWKYGNYDISHLQ